MWAHLHPIGVATVHGYTIAFWVAAGTFAIAAVVVGALVPSRQRLISAPAAGSGEDVSQPGEHARRSGGDVQHSG